MCTISNGERLANFVVYVFLSLFLTAIDFHNHIFSPRCRIVNDGLLVERLVVVIFKNEEPPSRVVGSVVIGFV